MALIKCPECKNDISDQADVCPKCGYEINGDNKSNKSNKKSKTKFDYKYLIIGLLIIVVGLHMLNNRNDNSNTGNDNPTTSPDSSSSTGTESTTPATNSGFVVYNDNNLGVSYEIPSTYKTYADSNNNISYVGNSIDDEGPLIPYIVLCWDSAYNKAPDFLNAFTNELKKVYGDVEITIDMITGTIGNYYVYGIQYQYNSGGHIIIDNRYAIEADNKIFMIGSKEENVNTDTINNVIRVIIETLK